MAILTMRSTGVSPVDLSMLLDFAVAQYNAKQQRHGRDGHDTHGRDAQVTHGGYMR